MAKTDPFQGLNKARNASKFRSQFFSVDAVIYQVVSGLRIASSTFSIKREFWVLGLWRVYLSYLDLRKISRILHANTCIRRRKFYITKHSLRDNCKGFTQTDLIRPVCSVLCEAV